MTTITSDTLTSLKAQADAELAQWPQYNGYHDGPEWALVTIQRDIRTKMGLAFTKGEVALARKDSHLFSYEYNWTAYSFRNHIHTSLNPWDAKRTA